MFAEPFGAALIQFRRFDRVARIAVVVLVLLYVAALLAPVIAPYGLSEQPDIIALKNHAPNFAHPFGTDRFSRDILTRVLYGARVSLSIATLAVLLSALAGTSYGLVAASVGGVIDSLMMRLLDAMLSIPRVLLLIAVLALWNPVPLAMLVLLIGLTGWFEVARLVRAEALSVREREYVMAARSLGARRLRIMFHHMLPNVLHPVVVSTTLAIGNVIVLEAGLSFIGIGVREPSASWGTMFQEGSEAFVGTWWAALFPGLAIVTTVLCVNILGDALRGLLDPRHLHGATRPPLGTRSAGLSAAPSPSR